MLQCPFVGVAEQRGEARAGVEAGSAQPVDAAVVADERGGLGVADERVPLDRAWSVTAAHCVTGVAFHRAVDSSTNASRSWVTASRSASWWGAEAVTRGVDQRAERVDGEAGLGEAGLPRVAVEVGVGDAGGSRPAAGGRWRGWR